MDDVSDRIFIDQDYLSKTKQPFVTSDIIPSLVDDSTF